MEATVETSSNFDLGAELDAAFDTPATTEAAPSPAPVEAAPDTPEVADVVEAEAEAPETEKPAEQAATEELPEGVEVKDRGDGKKTYSVRETQFNKLITSDRTVREIEGALGEPLTRDLVDSLYQAKLSEEKLYSDFLSNDPQKTGTILKHFKQLADHAMKSGESATNPFASMVMKMPEYLRQSDPQGFQWQRSFYARDTVDHLYQQAAQTGNEDLLRSVQWVEKALFNQFRKADQLTAQPVDPNAQREAQLTQREQQIQAFQQRQSEQQWNGFLEATNTAIQTARSEEIDAALSPIKESYKEFPDAYESYRERLNGLVRDALNKDERWNDYRTTIFERSKVAASEQVRQQLQAEYLTRFRAKLKSVVSPSTNPAVKRMLDQGAAAVKTQADLNRQRLSAAAQRREPGGGGTSKQNPVLPARTPNGQFASVDEIQREMEAAFG